MSRFVIGVLCLCSAILFFCCYLNVEPSEAFEKHRVTTTVVNHYQAGYKHSNPSLILRADDGRVFEYETTPAVFMTTKAGQTLVVHVSEWDITQAPEINEDHQNATVYSVFCFVFFLIWLVCWGSYLFD